MVTSRLMVSDVLSIPNANSSLFEDRVVYESYDQVQVE